MTYLQDPNAVLDYQWNWSSWVPVGDSIVSHSITHSPEIEVTNIVRVGSVVTGWIRILATGEVGRTYFATCRVTTANVPARHDDRTIEIVVGPR